MPQKRTVPSPAVSVRRRNVSFRPTAPVHEAIDALAREERRTFTQMLAILAEDALRARGAIPEK